jgi:hypothetical protein
MRDFWVPTGAILGTSAGIGVACVTTGKALDMERLIKTRLRFLGFSKAGFKIALA